MLPPPFYILCSTPALVHPTIEYHYTDDNPRALVPRPSEQLFVLDYHDDTPTVQSISPDVAVIGVRVEEAPGAAADAGDASRNDRMFIIDTSAANDRPMDGSMGERKPPHTVLQQFKQRSVSTARPCPDSRLKTP
ncbi:hypothetical protein C8R43DRAFT_1025670 [Mycena crocata]|nr:hypothetical protein C8R43DRAFT_1025670 [Mycena crocata]